jgi:rod shape-determining protein MreD
MNVSTHRPIAVFQVHPAVVSVAALAALLLQTFLPLKVPLARLMDFPLLVVIYVALTRRDRLFGIGLGTGLGVLQDALSHGYIGIFGIAKAVVGYLAASASTRFELESLVGRTILTGVFVLVHNLCVAGLQHALLEAAPPFQPAALASAVLVNSALGLILFQVLDRFRSPA